MPNDSRDRWVAKGGYQTQGIPGQIDHAERGQITSIFAVPSRSAAIAALIWCDHVIAGRRQRQKDLPPAIGQFRKAVQQQHAGPTRVCKAGFQHMHGEAVHAGDKTGTDAVRQNGRVIGGKFLHQ